MGKNQNENEQCEKDELQDIEQLGQIEIPDYESNIFTLPIIGEIEGHAELPGGRKATKYEHVIPQLLAVEQNPKYEGLFLIINTVGGDVEAGLAISEIISSISKPSVSLVMGGGHSIGVPLAVSSDYSYIVPTAAMTIHPIRMNGLVIGVSQSFEYFQKMQERIINFVVGHSEIEREKLLELMLNTSELANDMGTILIGKAAVDVGLMNEVGGLNVALAKMKSMIESNNKK